MSSASRIKHKKPGPMCGCTTALEDQPLVGVRDELILRYTPPAQGTPPAVRMRWKARADISVDVSLMLGLCPGGSAWGFAHAKAQFAPGLWTSEIALEMEDEELRYVTATESFDDPGVAFAVGGTVGTNGVGGSWSIPPGARSATLRARQTLNFNAASCLAPPSNGEPHDYVFFLDLEADTDARLSSAIEALATSSVEVIEFRVSIEDGCASCAGGQPAVAPGHTGGQ